MMIEMKVRWGVVFVALFAGLGLSACGGGGDDDGTSASLPPPPLPVPIVPTVSLAANPTSIAYNASSTLSWSSTDATSCTASGVWLGDKAFSGNESTGALTASGNYSLTCSGSGGSASASATVTVSVLPTTAILVWDAATDPVSGYRIYYGIAPGAYLQSLGQGVDVGDVTTYTVTGLSSGTRYYFAATAYDAVNNIESGYSNEVFTDIP